VPKAKGKREDMAAWFLNKATMPPTEATQLLARHLQCDESLRLSGILVNAVREGGQSKAKLLPTPSSLLAPLA
jgi:hypothetical protein